MLVDTSVTSSSTMSDSDPSWPSRQIQTFGTPAIPALFLDAGEQAWRRVIEFFTANLRNPNTRAAYAQAVGQFADWCHARHLALHQVSPFLIAAYIEEVGRRLAPPSLKQHLAALRMLFD